MKTLIFIILILLVLGFLGWAGYYYKNKSDLLSPSPSPVETSSPASTTHQILFPTGSETFSAGQTITLKWNGGSDPVQIFLIDSSLEPEGASVSTVDRVYGIKNSGSYDYTFPKTLANGKYKFQIGDLTSNYFMVNSASASGQISFCTPTQLQPQMQSEGAAGSIYINLTIKNIGSKDCQINGHNFIKPQYNASNVAVTTQGDPGQTAIILTPGQIVYSQVRFQNGPQCSSGINPIPVSLTYQISSTDEVSFKSTDSKALNLNACQNPAEQTKIDVWSISDKPVS